MKRTAGGRNGSGDDLQTILEKADSLDELREVDFGRDRGDAKRLSEDEVFDVLHSSLRRDILRYVQGQDGVSTVSDIAEYLAAKNNDTTVQRLSSYERKRVYIGLYQNHLPMMDDVGVIEYNKNRGVVHLQECASQLDPYIDEPETRATPQKRIGGYLLLAGVVVFGMLNVGASAVVPELLWIALGVSGLFGFTALDMYDSS